MAQRLGAEMQRNEDRQMICVQSLGDRPI